MMLNKRNEKGQSYLIPNSRKKNIHSFTTKNNVSYKYILDILHQTEEVLFYC